MKKDYAEVFDETKVIHRTEPIPNDTISVRSDMDEDFKYTFMGTGWDYFTRCYYDDFIH